MFINQIIAKIVSVMPENLVWIFSKRYIAGRELSDAVKISSTLNKRGIWVTIDVLGEYIKSKSEALDYKQSYLKTIDTIQKENLNASISVKPSMFGLLIDKDFCVSQIKEVIEKAKSAGITVCLDMEDSSCTDVEIDLFKQLYQQYPESVSFVLQAYMRRTLSDLQDLQKINNSAFPINIRICKGIYIEPEEIAFQKKKEVNDNYINCLEYMIKNGFYCSIATHDKRLIKVSEELIKMYQLGSARYEFQMLYGVRPELRKKQMENDHHVRVYVPYGTHWFGYCTRRLKENPRMISHIIKALFFRG